MLYIVDDEEVLRDALTWLAQSRQLHSRSFLSAAAFLELVHAGIPFSPEGDCLFARCAYA